MFLNKEYIGLALDGDVVKLAHVKKEGNKLRVIKLDSFTLVEKIEKQPANAASYETEGEQAGDEEVDPISVFGFDDEPEESSSSDADDQDDIDFEELEAQAKADIEDQDLLALDMVDEAEEGPQSNAILLYNILSEIDTNSVNV